MGLWWRVIRFPCRSFNFACLLCSRLNQSRAAAISGVKELELEPPLPTQPESIPASTTNTARFTNTLNLAASGTFSGMSPYPARDLGGFLTKRDPEALSLLRHPVDAIFEPESLRLGKV